MYKNIFKDKKRIILEKKRGAMLPGPRRRGSFDNAIFLLFFFTEVLWNFQVSANSKFPHLRISFPEQFFKKLTTFSPSFLQHLLQNFWSVSDYVLIKVCLAVLELF